MTAETCDQGTEQDFPNGIPTLCASAPEGIEGEYTVDVSIELPYKFDLDVSSNEVSGTTRELIMITSPNEEGETTRLYPVQNSNQGETEVVVTMLDENMGLPDRPKVIIS